MEEITGRLENWWVIDTWFNGNLFEDIHKRWKEGQFIHTSSVKDDLNSYKEGDIIKTRNSTYLLGKERE